MTPPELARVGTGSPEADEILQGGFPAGAIHILMGLPGTGKTILSQQMLFHNAAGERPVVYLATISEPLSKVLRYLQRFDFYDESKLLESIIYDDVGEELLRDGPGYILDHVRELVRTRSPRILVIDSFKALHDLGRPNEGMRELVYGLGSLLSAYDVTTFLVGEYASDAMSFFPEFAVADGVVQLERRGSSRADRRYLRVSKLRGSGYMEGVHAFRTTERGLEVYPRLVTPSVPDGYEPLLEQVPTGIVGLDPMLSGGLWSGSTTLVHGSTGTGKTTLGLGFVLDGVRRGEPCLFVHLQEGPTQIGQSIRRLGVDLKDYRERGLHLHYQSPVELTIDSLVVELFRVIRREGVRRLVIDGMTEVFRATEAERFHDYVYALTQRLKASGVTTILTMEAPHEEPAFTKLSVLCDTLIRLKHPMETGGDRRLLRVAKMRAAAHPLEPRPFEITGEGIRLMAEGESG